ncbi:MAG: hypothetical protein RID53_30380 [Coleofasciculus sp. B1-GNL1-01]|uniref:hypothetical protein n=1 Tax=Coleofasciculus sp. B1-GNL1-01 TaxID=3068484 RepID=UPI003303B7AE
MYRVEELQSIREAETPSRRVGIAHQPCRGDPPFVFRIEKYCRGDPPDLINTIQPLIMSGRPPVGIGNI